MILISGLLHPGVKKNDTILKEYRGILECCFCTDISSYLQLYSILDLSSPVCSCSFVCADDSPRSAPVWSFAAGALWRGG